MPCAFSAECKVVPPPSCYYRLDNQTYPVNGPLPCKFGRVWTIADKVAPTVDFEVACFSNTTGTNAGLLFSVTSLTCGAEAVNATVSAEAAADTCPQAAVSLELEGEH
jgi:hypothetical protein